MGDISWRLICSLFLTRHGQVDWASWGEREGTSCSIRFPFAAVTTNGACTPPCIGLISFARGLFALFRPTITVLLYALSCRPAVLSAAAIFSLTHLYHLDYSRMVLDAVDTARVSLRYLTVSFVRRPR